MYSMVSGVTMTGLPAHARLDPLGDEPTPAVQLGVRLGDGVPLPPRPR